MNTLNRLTLGVIFTVTSASLASGSILQLSEHSQVHLLADLELVFDDNIFRQDVEEQADEYFVFSPGFELKLSDDGAASATIRYKHEFVKFRDFSSLDDDYANFSAQAKYDTGVVLATIEAKYRELWSETIDSTDTEDLVLRDRLNVGGDVRYELSELTSVKVGAHYEDTDYELERLTDYDTWTIPAVFFYKIRPKVDLTAGIQYRTTDLPVEEVGFSGYEDIFYFVGVVGELFSPVIYADIRAGYQEREYDDLNFDDSMSTYDVSLIYTGDVKTTVYLTLSQDFSTSATGGNSYVRTSGTVGARYSLSKKIGLDASLELGENDYDRDSQVPGFPDSERKEDTLRFRLGAKYNPNDYLTFGARFDHIDIDGNDTPGASNYKINRFTVSASLRY